MGNTFGPNGFSRHVRRLPWTAVPQSSWPRSQQPSRSVGAPSGPGRTRGEPQAPVTDGSFDLAVPASWQRVEHPSCFVDAMAAQATGMSA